MQASLSMACQDRRLNRTDHRVLLYLHTRLSDDDWRALKRSTVAHATRTARPNVTTSLARLVSFGYIKRGESETGTSYPLKTYQLGTPREISGRNLTRLDTRKGSDPIPRKAA